MKVLLNAAMRNKREKKLRATLVTWGQQGSALLNSLPLFLQILTAIQENRFGREKKRGLKKRKFWGGEVNEKGNGRVAQPVTH